jgi:Fe(3+) dicitrate transport protein
MSAAEGTDEAMILDWVVRKSMRHGIQWHAGVNNVFDSVVVVARRPAGLRPGMPRLFRTGIRVAF